MIFDLDQDSAFSEETKVLIKKRKLTAPCAARIHAVC